MKADSLRTWLPTKKHYLQSLKQLKKQAIKPGEEVLLAMDVASSEFFNKEDGTYNLAGEGIVKTSAEMVDWYAELCEKYPIISIEDGLDENDWAGHKLLTERLGKKVQLVGDDLFVTNTEKLDAALKKASVTRSLSK